MASSKTPHSGIAKNARAYVCLHQPFQGEPVTGGEPATQTQLKYSNSGAILSKLAPLALFLHHHSHRQGRLMLSASHRSACFALLSLAIVAFAQPRRTPRPQHCQTCCSSRPRKEQRAIRAFNAARQKPPRTDTPFSPTCRRAAISTCTSPEPSTPRPSSATLPPTLSAYRPDNRSLFKPSATTRSLPPQPVCGEGNRRAEDAFKDQKLYDALIDYFSMRSFVPSRRSQRARSVLRHFRALQRHRHISRGEWLDEVATRAAAQNEQYLEIMDTPDLLRRREARLLHPLAHPRPPILR